MTGTAGTFQFYPGCRVIFRVTAAEMFAISVLRSVAGLEHLIKK
jgi:hypothetical protein